MSILNLKNENDLALFDDIVDKINKEPIYCTPKIKIIIDTLNSKVENKGVVNSLTSLVNYLERYDRCLSKQKNSLPTIKGGVDSEVNEFCRLFLIGFVKKLIPIIKDYNEYVLFKLIETTRNKNFVYFVENPPLYNSTNMENNIYEMRKNEAFIEIHKTLFEGMYYSIKNNGETSHFNTLRKNFDL